MRSLANNVSSNILRLAYFALFHSHLSYGVLIWGHSAIRHRLFGLQRKAVRIIDGVAFRDDCKNSFKKLKIFTLPCLYIYRCLEYVTLNVSKFHILGSDHSYNTRGNDLRYNDLRLSKSRVGVNYYCIKFFNIIPENIRYLPTKEFLKIMKLHLTEKALYLFEEYLTSSF